MRVVEITFYTRIPRTLAKLADGCWIFDLGLIISCRIAILLASSCQSFGTSGTVYMCGKPNFMGGVKVQVIVVIL